MPPLIVFPVPEAPVEPLLPLLPLLPVLPVLPVEPVVLLAVVGFRIWMYEGDLNV